MEPLVREFLKNAGYRIQERRHDWSDCLISGEGESWLGSGETSSEAFEAAVARCFPSAASKRALERAIAAEMGPDAARKGVAAEAIGSGSTSATLAGSEDRAAAGSGARAATGDAPAGASAMETAGAAAKEAAGAIEEGGPGAAADAAGGPPHAGAVEGPAIAAAVAGEATASARAGPAAEMGDVPPRTSDDPAPEADRPRLPFVTAPTEEERRAAGEALEALAARIEANRGEASALSPRRQRLLLLSWLAEARSRQSDPRGIGVTPSVLAIVKRLRALTESWWPGTVSAFQIHTTPASTRARDLRGFTDDVPETWSDVARLATEALRKLDEEEAAAGCDAEGWADRAQTFPPPPDPESMLASLMAELEAAGGPLEGSQPKGGRTPPAADLERWARHLRWLRVPCSKDPRWGAAAGRLRFWTQRVSGFSTAAEYLDPAYRPPRSWATLIGANQQRAREALTLERVIESVPPATADDGALVAWLDRALPLTGSHQNTILQACAGLHDRILAIDEGRLGESDRRIRRRLQKLKSAISTRDEEPAPPSDVAAAPEEPEVEAEEPEVLPDELRALTRGKRALFVGNRTDGALQERLQAMLELERLEWAEATPRRVDAAVKAIASSAYGFVFGATGFMGHKYDSRLARACRASGTPYLRVDRGRPGAVARALSRDLGGPIAAAN